MTLRLNRLYVDVAGKLADDGDHRLYRQYMSVLIQDSAAPVTHDETVNQTLNVSDLAQYRFEISPCEDTLNLSDEGLVNVEYVRSVENDLDLIDFVRRVHPESVEDTLAIVDELFEFNYVADRAPAGNELNLTQEVLTLSSIEVTQNLGITQNAEGRGAIRPAITQWLALSSRTSTPHRVFVTDELELTSVGYTPIVVTANATNNLVLVDYARLPIVDTLNLTQIVAFGFAVEAENTLNLTDEFQVQGLWVRAITHALGIGHALTWMEDTPCKRKQYTPFQGEYTTSLDVAPPYNTLTAARTSKTDRFVLYTIGRATEVVLRAPELDNRDRNAYTRISNETRGGKLIVYSDPIWPKVRTLAVTITGLKETEIDTLQTFLQDTLGQLIGLEDWEGNEWQGFITQPDEVATQDGKERWTVSFEFEGEMLEDREEDSGMYLNLSDSAEYTVIP